MTLMFETSPMTTEGKKSRRWRLPHGWMLWLTLTAIGVATSMGSWFSGDMSERAEGVKPLCNAIQMLVLPGWAVVRLLSHVWHASPLSGAIVANAIGWGMWWVGAHVVLKLRARLVKRLSPASQDPASSDRAPIDVGRR